MERGGRGETGGGAMGGKKRGSGGVGGKEGGRLSGEDERRTRWQLRNLGEALWYYKMVVAAADDAAGVGGVGGAAQVPAALVGTARNNMACIRLRALAIMHSVYREGGGGGSRSGGGRGLARKALREGGMMRMLRWRRGWHWRRRRRWERAREGGGYVDEEEGDGRSMHAHPLKLPL